MNPLEIRQLCKTYPGFSLEDVSLTLPCGCVLGLVGENGAGKTTLIKLILDMVHRDNGSITVLGRDNRDNFPLTKEDLGVVLDNVGIPACLNTHQVGKIMALTYANWDWNTYQTLLERLSIPQDKAFRTLSRGNQMKLGIVIALAHHPKLLLLDEPTSGLDPVVRDDVVELLRDFVSREDHAILISSHIVSDLEKLCDYIAFLHQGKLLLVEEKDRLLEEYGLLLCEEGDLNALPQGAVLGKRVSPYGVQALVKRSAVPAGLEIKTIGVEELFILLTKEEVRL